MKIRRISIVGFILMSLMLSQCGVLQTLTNLSRLKFKLNGIESVYVEGISVTGKKRVDDFNMLQIASVVSAVNSGRLRVSLVVNLAAVNPNDGTGGFPQTNAVIKSFPFRLLVDNEQIITGNINAPFDVPGTGQSVVLPISLDFDIFQLAREKGYQHVLNLVTKLAGLNSNSESVAIYARPVVSSIIGDLSYPQEIKIISTSFK